MSSDSSDSDALTSKILTTFRPEIIKEALKTKFSNSKNKISEDALELVAELSKMLVIEATVRAQKLASQEDSTNITLNHVENILPQLMLDFP